MSVLDYESSPQIVSREIQSNIWTTIKPVISFAALSTTLYILGFIATNASLAFWGIYDPEPIHTSSILTGVLFLIYLVLALIPTLVYEYFAPKSTQVKVWLLVIISCLVPLLLCAGLLNQVEHRSWVKFFSSPPLWVLPIIFTVLSCGFGFWLKSSPIAFAKKYPMSERIFMGLLASLGLFSLISFFGVVYLNVPARWGGGEPIEREVWFSKDAGPILKAMNITTVQDGDLIKAPQLWVLYSRGDLQIFCEHKTCSKGFQVSKDWIKSQSWLTGINTTLSGDNATPSKPRNTP